MANRRSSQARPIACDWVHRLIFLSVRSILLTANRYPTDRRSTEELELVEGTLGCGFRVVAKLRRAILISLYFDLQGQAV
jgi:hypothetical protein